MENRGSQLSFAQALVLSAVIVLVSGFVAAQADDATVYTNDSLDRLPAPGNTDLPSLEQQQGSSQIAGRPLPAPAEGAAAPSTTAQPAPAQTQAVDPAEWLRNARSQADRSRRIDEARRRVNRATEEVAQLQRGFREQGSAFGDGRSDDMFSRGVADSGDPYQAALKQAYEEIAAARAALSALLTEQPSAPAADDRSAR